MSPPSDEFRWLFWSISSSGDMPPGTERQPSKLAIFTLAQLGIINPVLTSPWVPSRERTAARYQMSRFRQSAPSAAKPARSSGPADARPQTFLPVRRQALLGHQPIVAGPGQPRVPLHSRVLKRPSYLFHIKPRSGTLLSLIVQSMDREPVLTEYSKSKAHATPESIIGILKCKSQTIGKRRWTLNLFQTMLERRLPR